MMLAYHLAWLVVLGFLFAILLWNLKVVTRLNPEDRPERYPFLSVLVPARNEERNIERSIRSLLDQDYPHYEVLVFDDESQDATHRILETLARENPRLRILGPAVLPPGWLGKCFACGELARNARGDLLLFTDADTVHDPGSLSSSVAESERTGADLLTLITRLEMKTFSEKLLLPLVHFIALTYLPFALISRSRNSKFAIGNGQFMLFRRPAYHEIGGHTSVKDALVEDVWLARLVKARGFRVVVRDGFSVVSCRMYRSFREIWRGFSKNMFAGFSYSVPAISAVMMFNLAAYVLPLLVLLTGIFSRREPVAWVLMPGLQLALAVGMRLILAVRFRLGLASAFFHFLGMGVVIAIAVNSVRWILSGQGAQWKGRTYRFPAGLRSRGAAGESESVSGEC